jgi:hypothetical protein
MVATRSSSETHDLSKRASTCGLATNFNGCGAVGVHDATGAGFDRQSEFLLGNVFR